MWSANKADELAHALQPVQAAVSTEAESRRRVKATESLPVQNAYFGDLVDCVGPLAQSLSYVWQDTNRKLN